MLNRRTRLVVIWATVAIAAAAAVAIALAFDDQPDDEARARGFWR